MKTNLSTISYMVCAFGVVSITIPRLSRFTCMLSSRNFIVCHFTLESVIHFEISFVKHIRFMSKFILFVCTRSSGKSPAIVSMTRTVCMTSV